MNYEVVELAEKTVIGIKAITSNQDPKMSEIIGGLWKSFYEDAYSKISGAINKKAIGLYCDYGTPNKDDYTVMVCTEVDSDGAKKSLSQSKDLTVKKIPSGRYAKFTVKGNVSTATAECWNEIWAALLERTFTGDFEEYQEDCDGVQGTIIIYIAIK